MNKEGLSPIIATFLLIAFAVSLGAVVMTYGSAYYEESQKKSTLNASLLCSEVNLEVHSTDGSDDVCIAGSQIRYLLVNSGSESISAVQMWALGTKIYVSELPDSSADPAYPIDGVVDYDISIGIPKQIKFIPKIVDKQSKKTFVCFDKSVEIKAIRYC